MTTHATIVRNLIAKHNPVACSPSMGYMVTADHNRINFSDHYGDGTWKVPSVVKETRNKHGRCTSIVLRYSDGSMLRYGWSEFSGPRYRVVS